MKQIAITGGGTGGHLAIAKALKEELGKRGIKPVFMGSSNGQDKAWFEDDEGLEKAYFFDTAGVVNKGFWGKIKSLLNIFKHCFTCMQIFKTHKIEAVFCVGGYSAAPASFAALITCKPLYIHEQNAKIGSLNKILRPLCKEFFSSYHESIVSDYPVRSVFFETARKREELKTIIFLGGSQGASAINDVALNCAISLNAMGIKIIHQCGKLDYQKCYDFYTQNGVDADVFDFDKALHVKIASSDFAISRAGASTLWELSANGLPTLFVPYPYASSDHQYHNAKALKDKNAALIIRQNELTSEALLHVVHSLDLKKLSENLSDTIKPNAISKIADIVLQK